MEESRECQAERARAGVALALCPGAPAWRRWLVSMLLVSMLLTLLPALIPVDARAQVFLAEHPAPEFMIGPLFIRATVHEPPAPVTVDVLWSLVVPPGHTATGLEQDLYLLWPGAIQNRPDLGKPDPALAKFVEARGFTVIDEG